MPPIISVKSLSKSYRIGHCNAPYDQGLRHVLTRFIKHPFQGSINTELVWALKDVSFDVQEGEVIGIIGRNGAGKSTLLKILSRITMPTSGEARLRGRVASLLEVGTGFHPELTGRENIFLNGSILGMTRAEVKSKFDEIVAFSEIERFLDTPVKHYSSGMYVRLAFAVAAHLDPEILLVDEVLAVGDIAFQKKCLGKMRDVASQGRTVILVSHHMGSISRLASRCILLDRGLLEQEGPPPSVIARYLNVNTSPCGRAIWADDENTCGDLDVRLLAVSLLQDGEEIQSNIDIQKPSQVAIDFSLLRDQTPPRIGIRLATQDGTIVFTSATTTTNVINHPTWPAGTYHALCTIPGNLLNEGIYVLFHVWADHPFLRVHFLVESTLTFRVEQTGGVGSALPESANWLGIIRPDLKWQIEPSNHLST